MCAPALAAKAPPVLEPSQRYRAELEGLIKARLKPGERALPELKSSPTVCLGWQA